MSDGFQYTSGWIDTTIHDFLSEIEPSLSIAYGLITCLDSTCDVASLVERNAALRDLHDRGELGRLGKGVFLKTRHLLSLDRDERLLFGFDEIWLSSKPPLDPKPDDIVITGPGRIADQTLDLLPRWMRKNYCSLGLGDGAGMNFCVKLSGAAKYVVDALQPANTDDAPPISALTKH